MPQKIKTVPITLDRVRHLRYDVNALLDLGDELELNLMTKEGWEELVGKTAMEDGKEKFVPAEQSFRKVRAIIWAGLRHEDESLTIRQVGAMLDSSNMAAAIDAYTQAWDVSDATTHEGDPESPLAESGSSAARA